MVPPASTRSRLPQKSLTSEPQHGLASLHTVSPALTRSRLPVNSLICCHGFFTRSRPRPQGLALVSTVSPASTQPRHTVPPASTLSRLPPHCLARLCTVSPASSRFHLPPHGLGAGPGWIGVSFTRSTRRLSLCAAVHHTARRAGSLAPHCPATPPCAPGSVSRTAPHCPRAQRERCQGGAGRDPAPGPGDHCEPLSGKSSTTYTQLSLTLERWMQPTEMTAARPGRDDHGPARPRLDDHGPARPELDGPAARARPRPKREAR